MRKPQHDNRAIGVSSACIRRCRSVSVLSIAKDADGFLPQRDACQTGAISEDWFNQDDVPVPRHIITEAFT